MQAIQDEGHAGAGPSTPAAVEGVQQDPDGVIWRRLDQEIDGKKVVAFECRDMRLSDSKVLMILQGMSALRVLTPTTVTHNNQIFMCLPIIAEGFCAYDVPVRFRRVVVGVPQEEPIPFEVLVSTFARSS